MFSLTINLFLDEEKGDDMNAGDSKVSDKSDNDDSSCDSDSVESEAIDDEEVQLLMNETGLPSDYIDLTSTKMRLRKKPEVEEITVHEPKGRSDIGQLVAVVRRGVLLVGRVVAYQPSRSVPKKEASTILDNGGSTVATGESHELSQLEDIPTDSAVLKIEENENGNSKELTTFPSVVSAENTVVAPAGISNGLWTVILGSEMVEATLTYDEIR